MQTYQHHITELKHSLQLPKAIEELNAFWKDEQERRRQFLAEMDEGVKAEFVEGEIVLHSPAKDKHTEVRGDLEYILQSYLQPRQIGFIRSEKALLHLVRNDFEPDIAYWPMDKKDVIDGETMLYPPPSWVCEILSSSTSHRDRGIKFRDYAANNIPEYWIIDPNKRVVEQYLLKKGAYELLLKSSSGVVESIAIRGLKIPIAAIFVLEDRLNLIDSFRPNR